MGILGKMTNPAMDKVAGFIDKFTGFKKRPIASFNHHKVKDLPRRPTRVAHLLTE